MDHRPLGRTGETVSALCLGTMTFGSQNTEAEAHRQLDLALERGVDFVDTAEMYPTTPLKAETVGRTEEFVGSWLEASEKRERIFLATKITGEGNAKVRDGAPIGPDTLREAVEGSLRRLRTDVIDLYQLHWPNRGSYHFRQSWTYDPSGQNGPVNLDDIRATLETAGRLLEEGKIRHLGLSNETAWGVTRFCAIAEAEGLPRVVSIQNEYSLLHRIYDLDLAETSANEDVGLLAYSPLAAGMLTGKYSGGHIPAGSRASINEGLGGRLTERGIAVADRYAEIARRHGLDPAQMAIAFCLSRPFMTSVIVGATSEEQLTNVLDAADLRLSDEVVSDIAAVHRDQPIPL